MLQEVNKDNLQLIVSQMVIRRVLGDVMIWTYVRAYDKALVIYTDNIPSTRNICEIDTVYKLMADCISEIYKDVNIIRHDDDKFTRYIIVYQIKCEENRNADNKIETTKH